jgi:Methane oxygenase PmoA
MTRLYFSCALFLFLFGVAHAQPGFSLVEKKNNKKVEVLYNGRLLTAYCYFDSTEKPILFPIKTFSGVTVTRGYPIAPRPGERTDHPHQVGLWLNYESVNGLDFWNNSFAIAADRKQNYGSIKHQKIISTRSKKEKATLKTLSHWVDHTKKILLEEETEFVFRKVGNHFIIDRTTTLKAKVPEVVFKDVKDGLLGLRVARELELPSKENSKFVDAQGNVTDVPPTSAEVTGTYVNAEGLRGDAVWGKRSAWTYLTGKKDGQLITIAIIDHPSNPGYPTYWHARGYGLFAANPLGQKIFSNGKEELNFRLKQNQTVVFRYRVVVTEGSEITVEEMERLFWKGDN